MCGRFTLRTPLTVLTQQFLFDLTGGEGEAALAADYRPRYNIAPTQQLTALRAGESGKRRATRFRWGLIPSWAKDPKIAYSTINARADSVAEKPAFRSAFRKRRCLVLADGYYEWKTIGKAKQPYLFHFESERPFAFGGLWEAWHPPGAENGPPLETCSLITTEANEVTSAIHDRMPVIIQPIDYDRWLDPNFQNVDELKRLLAPYEPAEEIRITAVNPLVNNARNESPECVAEVEPLT